MVVGSDGERYRLSSEAEWEYAARAGVKKKKYSWGNEAGSNRANCDGCGSQWDDRQTAPVGSFGPNGWGLYDLHGNVFEWVQDCANLSYQGAPTNGSASSGSGWPGLLPLESLNLYFLWGSRGHAPWLFLAADRQILNQESQRRHVRRGDGKMGSMKRKKASWPLPLEQFQREFLRAAWG